MKWVKQFVFTNSAKPEGNIVKDSPNISQLGIQAPPGVKFSLNDGEAITMGKTGIYELDLGEVGRIQSIVFKELSLNSNEKILVDIIYEK